MLEKSGMEGRNSDEFNVTESFAVNKTGQPRGYERTGWEQSAALITAHHWGPQAVPAGRQEVEDMAAIIDLALLGR